MKHNLSDEGFREPKILFLPHGRIRDVMQMVPDSHLARVCVTVSRGFVRACSVFLRIVFFNFVTFALLSCEPRQSLQNR